MKLFKKEIEIDFIDKVKARILTDIKQTFSRSKFMVSLPIYLWVGLFSLNTISVFISFFLYGYSPFNINWAFLSGFISFISAVGLIEILDKFLRFKKKEKKLNFDSFHYKDFFKEEDFELSFYLDKEEVQELFKLPLTTEQLHYLQDIIQDKGCIHFKYLDYFFNLPTQEQQNEEKRMGLIKKNNKAKKRLAKFFSDHDIYNDFNAQQLQEQLKEKELSLTNDKSHTSEREVSFSSII